MHENNHQSKHSEAPLRTVQRREQEEGEGEGGGSRAEQSYRAGRESQLYRHIAVKLQLTRLSFKCCIIKIA